MQFYGIIVHHSVCPAINGKGYDFFIAKSGAIIPSSEQTDPLYIHICLEGDFSVLPIEYNTEEKEQLFLLNKLIQKLSDSYKFHPADIFPHTNSCPGRFFPWSQLVISPEDRYH
ncbi:MULTISPECIES: N-acetylmuramoyl-L-alanine amidase [Paenibacillus]|uniref:Uncharacterized protein n=1 Tax=Paenibacillus naphthalenovorans TaxID=162209 RepID=A0A0U2U957_9BACL|nr:MULTISPECIES: N-acetylmuramoyl-L-alanine amidase [Paenibacillus]ALS22728.1 hypothetical protein IJ22_23550 [Paenibacillus naphthalenovorans]NTZ17664.1 hypothetical protein [Paenibacillus sp. JMULE4]GCL70523.1 hypothetical protein PN4B1_04250 [Paenibacillus naphthalenovorans]SDH79504.1 N-acetylmuramoyl-L-alanine amidase [Paenibacillus naphthalenovorans]